MKTKTYIVTYADPSTEGRLITKRYANIDKKQLDHYVELYSSMTKFTFVKAEEEKAKA